MAVCDNPHRVAPLCSMLMDAGYSVKLNPARLQEIEAEGDVEVIGPDGSTLACLPKFQHNANFMRREELGRPVVEKILSELPPPCRVQTPKHSLATCSEGDKEEEDDGPAYVANYPGVDGFSAEQQRAPSPCTKSGGLRGVKWAAALPPPGAAQCGRPAPAGWMEDGPAHEANHPEADGLSAEQKRTPSPCSKSGGLRGVKWAAALPPPGAAQCGRPAPPGGLQRQWASTLPPPSPSSVMCKIGAVDAAERPASRCQEGSPGGCYLVRERRVVVMSDSESSDNESDNEGEGDELVSGAWRGARASSGLTPRESVSVEETTSAEEGPISDDELLQHLSRRVPGVRFRWEVVSEAADEAAADDGTAGDCATGDCTAGCADTCADGYTDEYKCADEYQCAMGKCADVTPQEEAVGYCVTSSTACAPQKEALAPGETGAAARPCARVEGGAAAGGSARATTEETWGSDRPGQETGEGCAQGGDCGRHGTMKHKSLVAFAGQIERAHMVVALCAVVVGVGCARLWLRR